MRVFVTGATGFIGSAVVRELIDGGHEVLGLTRSEEGAARLRAAGATPHLGRLEDIESLRRGAQAADGVIHLAFMHAFTDAPLGTRIGAIARGLLGQSVASNFLSAILRVDREAIDAMGKALERNGGPLVVTVGTLGLPHGHVVSEFDEPSVDGTFAMRNAAAESAVRRFAERGVRGAIVRLPPTVHGEGDGGFIPRLIATARKRGVSAYVGDGENHWPAVHRLDVARLYRRVLEDAAPGERAHGVAEEGVPFREIAELIGRRLGVPAVSKTRREAEQHFGWFAPIVAADNPATSNATRERFHWAPREAALLADIDRPAYFGVSE